MEVLEGIVVVIISVLIFGVLLLFGLIYTRISFQKEVEKTFKKIAEDPGGMVPSFFKHYDKN